MLFPELPPNESERIKSFNSHEFESIYNSEEFNFLTELAAQISGCEISLISLSMDDKQWFLSHFGLQIREIPLEHAFCVHAILDPERELTIENTLLDERFVDNPFVVGEPNIRFYSGIPLQDQSGLTLGTLCVIDKIPRKLDKDQVHSLRKIANQIQRLFELQRLRVLERKIFIETAMNLALLEDSQQLNRVGAWSIDLVNQKLTWTKVVYEIHEVDHNFVPNYENAVNFYHPEDQSKIAQAVQGCVESGQEFNVQCRLITAKGKTIWVRSSGKKKENFLVGSFQDITTIKEREIKFSSIINASSSLLVILDHSGRITELNNTCTELVKINRSEFIDKYFWDCNYWNLNESYIDNLKNKFQKALEGIESAEEIEIWLFNKIPFTIQLNVRPVYDELKQLLFVLVEAIPIQDIVDERNNNRFILEGANVATGFWDYVTDDLFFDERWYKMLGYSMTELAPMTLEKWISFYHPEDLVKCREQLYSVFRKEIEYYDCEARLKHKNGHWIWVHDKGKVLHWSIDNQPLSMYGIHQNITLRKERELRLTYQENILNALFIGSPVGIVLTDFESSRYLDINNAFLELLGYEKDALMKLTYKDITPHGYLETEKQIKQDLFEKSHYTSFHKEYIRKDGTLVSVIIQGVLIQDTEGRDLVWTFVQDITKEKRAENEISELLLLTQDQNERLHNFARIVSHNLKNHSDGILGILELLSEQNPEIAENKYLKLFEKSAKNLVQTISFLSEEKLLLSKLGFISMEKIDFSALLNKNLESLAAEIMKVDFIIDNQVSSGVFIQGVFAYLDSIILNLISNALKYKKPNTLSQLTIKHVSSSDFEVIEFIDNGLGIDLDLHGNDVFGLYKTFHENKDRRGIGLFISKNQIEQMGGKIQVESQLNQGTTFRLFLQKY